MAYGNDNRFTSTGAPARAGVAIDEGLRSYMLKVYNYMASGVLLTGLVAMYTVTNEAMLGFVFNNQMLVMFAPLGFVLVLSFGINKLSATAAQGVFWGFSAIMGLSLSTILLIYTGESVARIFFITAGAFGGLSLFGYTTKRDLSGMGTFLVMGLIGLIIASVVNIFMASSMMHFIISVVGVLIFAGLTAYDTQKIKHMYSANDHADIATKKTVMGALTLYLDFINMFLFLLRLFGNRH